MLAVYTLALLGCGGPPVLPPAEQVPATVLLARHPELARHLEVPARSWPEEQVLDEEIELTGGGDGAKKRFPVAARSVWYGHEEGRRPFGMEVRSADGALKYSRRTRDADTWRYDAGQVVVRSERPGLTWTWPRAIDEERANSRHTFEGSDEDFVFRSQALTETVEYGLYLPAPAEVRFAVDIEERSVLTTTARLLTPAWGEGTSDGAELVVEAGGVELARYALTPGESKDLRVDLGAAVGQELVLRTEPVGTSDHDYVFLSEPAVYVPHQPRRMVLVFVDTLRPDHMSVYGYERETTPFLEELAPRAVVFEEARSTAPWTLPSVRAFLSGRHADHWDEPGVHVADLLGDAGWTSVGMVTNTWLARTFGMDRAWSVYWSEASADVEDQVARARAFMDAYSDRDTAVMVHIMDAHLPYEEPSRYRGMWTGQRPSSLDDDTLDDSNANRIWARTPPAERQVFRDYTVARYDQNVRWIDDSLRDLVEAAGEDATLVVFADHGEEFWEHGELGHGFNLHEQSLRVPLIVVDPRAVPGRVTEPVSLLDLLPTLVDLGGGEVPAGLNGQSLAPVILGQGSVEPRPLAFGWTAFRHDGWGVAVGGQKWVTSDGAEHVWSLADDPGEEHDLVGQVELAPFYEALSVGLGGRPVHRVWRLAGVGSGTSWGHRADVVRATHPGGFAAVWARPSFKYELAAPELTEDGTAEVRWSRGHPLPREVYLLPSDDPLIAAGLEVEVNRRDRTRRAVVGDVPPPDGTRQVLATVGDGRGAVEVTWSVQPEPVEMSVTDLTGSDLESSLEALGYVER